MAGLRLLKGKFYIRVWIDGKEKLLPTGTSNRRDAEIQRTRIERQETEIKQKIRDEIDAIKNRLTIQAGVDFFIKNIGTERNVTGSTVKTYRLAVNDFINALGRLVYFNSIKRENYSDLLNYLQARYNSTTVNIRLRGIRAMLNYLDDKGMIQKPFHVKQIKADKHLPKFITPDEMDAIYKQVDDPKLAATFRVYEFTGMRLSELFHSRLDGDFIKVEQSKGRKERIIPIPFQNVKDYQLATINPYSISFISHSFSKACKAAGITGKTLHALRHTFALRKLIETNNIQLVKELLGHSSVTVTEIYTAFPTDYLVQVFKDRAINSENYRPSIQA
ncbi:MAG TPA: tyrosine-type recombinase/integrase [Candidatus Marinimicrobia bacterium]|nr:tyrosine-type recombinase/integrase [Candidatus Neomarinimicrobiota bacterium]HRS51826.1 tyrosine-type recombinase/integrase [Candidatus Neomarinimicrobiota bacterium]HRU92622.1 tyrosine-type recombinase/integrase [Candidatus Neomarinimicrobiota bacterium]